MDAPEKSLAATKDFANEAGFPLRKVSSDPYGGDKGDPCTHLPKCFCLALASFAVHGDCS